MSWSDVTLGDVAANIQTGPFGSQLHQSDYSDNGIPVVMPKDLIGGKISEQSIARVSQQHVDRLNRHIIEVGDILYSRRGDVGRCAYATKYEAGWLCGTGCLRVTVDPNIADSRFVFYQLQLPSTIGWVEKHAVGATMLNLNTGILSSVPIRIPRIELQRKIAETLSAYDDLIENNQKQIKLLEETAQRIYKEWFVDLRFPKYEQGRIVGGIPEGWKETPLGEMFSFVRGKSYTSSELSDTDGILLVNLKNIRAWGGYKRDAEKRYLGTYKDNQTLSEGDIVMAVTDMTQERRLVGHVALVPKLPMDAIHSMDLIKVIPRPGIPQYYLYSILRFSGIAEEIAKHANGTNVLHLRPESISAISTLVADVETSNKYDEIVRGFYSKIEYLETQNLRLAEARDRLLPKLMSGEIEV